MRYLIGDLIGAGSFGRVHEAHDRAGRKHAAKVVDPGDEIGLGLLRAQYRLLSAADHPRIVTVYDLVEDTGHDPYLVMEYIDGRPLVDHVREAGPGGLPRLAVQVLDALRNLHSLGGVHGDLKPDSILVCGSGDSLDVKLVDVGFDAPAAESLPTLRGTLPYLAPEAIRSAAADGRSDLYSLGVVLFEALTGACPFSGSSPEEIMDKHLDFSPPPPSTVSADIDPAWDDLVLRLLSKEPMQRYPSALHAAMALGEAFGDPGLVAGELSPPRTLARFWNVSGERVEAVISRGTGRAIVVMGSPGAGTASVLRNAGARLKSKGARVVTVTMDADAPVSSQVIESLAAHGAGVRDGGGDGPPQVSDSHLFSLDSILSAYDVNLDGDRKHAILVEGGSSITAAGVTAMARLAAERGRLLDVVLGVESGRDASGAIKEQANVEIVPMEPLTRDGIEEVVRQHFGTSVVPVDLVDALLGNTRGNALLLEETLSEIWTRRDLRYRVNRDALEIEWMNTVALPDSLRRVIEDRVGGLDEASLHVAAMIALAGGSLERVVVLEMEDAGRGEAAVDALIRTDIIHEAGGQGLLRFNHGQARSIVRDRVPPEWSGPMALRLAGALEAAAAGPETSYRIGLLYLEGGSPHDAFPYLLRAGEHFARFSIGDALLAYGRALECDPPAAERSRVEEKMGDLKVIETDLDSARDLFERASHARPEAAGKLGWVEALKGDYEAAERILIECEASARERGDEAERSRVALDLAYVYATRGKIDESLEVIREARRFFEREHMPFETGMAAYREGISHMRAGAHIKAVALWQEGIPFFEEAGNFRLVAQSLQAIGLSSRKHLDYEKARESLERSLQIWSDLSGLSQRGATANTYAFVLLETGDLLRAREYADKALELNSLAGQKTGVLLANLLIAGIELEMGNWKNAEDRLLKVQGDVPPEDLYLRAQVQRYLAVARTVAGDRDRALALAQESHSSARLAGDEEGKYHALLEKAAALLRFDKYEEAADAARDALVGLSNESSLLLAARALALLGEALCLAGNGDEGFEKLQAARDNLIPVSKSQYMARALMGLARASYLNRDHATFVKYLDESINILRGGEARYDYAAALYLGGAEAMQRGGFLRARHYFAEAARIYESLEIEDLHGKVVNAMEAVPSGEFETRAVNSLSRISEALISSRDLDGVLNVAMDLAMDYLGADRGVLMLAAEGTDELVTVVERKMDEESLREVIGISKSIVDSVHSTGEAVIATDLRDDPRFSESKSIRAQNIMAVMCLPLMRAGNLLGLIYLDTRGIPTRFTDLERAFVDAFTNQVALAVENARMVGSLRDSFEDLRTRVGEKYNYSSIIGPGKRMQEVFRQVEKAAPTDTSILLTGENGTGKDLVAGLIHELSPRKDAPLIMVNCPAIAKDLVESELFGIEKSVATGVAPRSGYFERADGGTIFLNEIGDLSLATQVRVLRVIDRREFERVGGSKVMKVDVRVVSATNRDLRQLIDDGLFRKDLYFRINHIQISLPPLRERMEDLGDLIAHFVREYAAKNRKPVKRVSREALDLLRRHTWPGNVRELERCIERAVVFAEGEEIKPEDISEEITLATQAGGAGIGTEIPGRTLPERIAAFEKLQMMEALESQGWVKSRAARMLGIHEATLRKKMKGYGIAKSPKPRGF